MPADHDAIRRIFDEAEAFARSYRFEMTDDYRRLIEQVEALPRNQSGADRSGQWLGSRADAKAVFARFERVRDGQ